MIFSSLDGKIRAVDLCTDTEETNIKYELDQGSPIFFCVVLGYQEIKFLNKKEQEEDTPKRIQDQVIHEDSKGEVDLSQNLTERKQANEDTKDEAPKTPSADDSSKEIKDSARSGGNSKSKINMNLDIKKTMAKSKLSGKKIINGLFDINKQVLDDPEAEEMLSKGMCYIVATINQKSNNSIILWNLMTPSNQK